MRTAEANEAQIVAETGREPVAVEEAFATHYSAVFRQVQRLMREGTQIVVVLPREDYEQEHLPGAINIPLKELDPKAASSLRKDRPIVVYCHDFQ